MSETTTPSLAETMTLPLELLDQCVGKKLRVYLRDRHVYEGTLVGFDDLVNLVMDNVTEVAGSPDNSISDRMLISSRTLTMLAPL
ncbi:RNA-binding protein [Pichia kluyveri]|uniref:RNA-binding protein n=1 Tax=Pichia kluyveri TaxID=36015 RepID=A0AAV5R1B2_PICKL|nr:RNA-binding protein [Pichia kluyveri]